MDKKANIDNYDPATPKKKRPFLEVSISPDGKGAMDPSDLRDVLDDILDQTFEEQTKSIQGNFAKLESKSEAKQEESSKAISNHRKRSSVA